MKGTLKEMEKTLIVSNENMKFWIHLGIKQNCTQKKE